MKQLYACYEQSATGWGLVVYHDGKPGKPSYGSAPNRTPFYEVPEEFIEIDGTPNLGKIAKAYPNPMAPEPEEKDIGYPLPDWAVDQAPKGKWTVMQQLVTKDPHARGNATLAGIMTDCEWFLVVTDANNWITYNLAELNEAYEPGNYIFKEFPNPKSKEDFEARIFSNV